MAKCETIDLFQLVHESAPFTFSRDDILQQIVHILVLSNVMLKDEVEELFEINFVEFIRRDMEGTDLYTRRRIAQIQNCLGSFAASPKENWKCKDCAIYLVVSLATKRAGGSSVSTELVEVDKFFRSVIVPELRQQDVNASLMLKAAALKFFTVFWNQVPKYITISLLPVVICFLTADSNVVHSYAATCIEKLFLVIDDGSKARYTSADLSPVLLMLMTNLFTALKKTDSEDNQYVMKCIMRVLGIADITKDVYLQCISGLATVLMRVCQNPINHIFNHYLFESVAVLIRWGTEEDPPFCQKLKMSFFLSSKWYWLKKYLKVWKRTANVPALVRLLLAFLRKAPLELNQQGKLLMVLGIFNTLVSSHITDEFGFYVLNTVIENVGYDVLSTYISHIWDPLYERLDFNLTEKFTKSLLIFMSLFLVKYEAKNLVNSMNDVRPNAFPAILEKVWMPNLKLITGPLEIKLTSVEPIRLINESPTSLDSKLWRKMLDSVVTLLSRPEEERVLEELEVPDFWETVFDNPTFVHLYNAEKKEEDPLKEIMDPKLFLQIKPHYCSFAAHITFYSEVFPILLLWWPSGVRVRLYVSFDKNEVHIATPKN
ncbi:transporter [Lithospermum erythrorhizon]|uniref:Transporter n=1 Tax=Lithospermum erythrorhizon TaxID=34254 RepID=A0AAV3RB04_LITER